MLSKFVLALLIPLSAQASGLFLQANQLCTGDRIITEDGLAGRVVALFLDGNRVSVQLDGFRGADIFTVDELARLNTCDLHGTVCTGDRVVTEAGNTATIAAILPGGQGVLINVDGFIGYQHSDLSDLAVTNACESIGSCRYRHNRVMKRYP